MLSISLDIYLLLINFLFLLTEVYLGKLTSYWLKIDENLYMINSLTVVRRELMHNSGCGQNWSGDIEKNCQILTLNYRIIFL